MVGEDASFVFNEWEDFGFGAGGGAIMIDDGAKHSVWCGDGCHLYRWNRVGLNGSCGVVPCCVREGWKLLSWGGIE